MWDEIFELHYTELLSYGVKLCHSMQQAEDLVQEVFLRALQNTDTFEDLGKNQRRAWLFRTLKNLFCDRYRRALLEEQYACSIQEDAVSLESGFQQTEAQLLLAQLPEQDRALFYLRYLENYSAAELAALFDLPAGTVRSRLARSRKCLREILGEE